MGHGDLDHFDRRGGHIGHRMRFRGRCRHHEQMPTLWPTEHQRITVFRGFDHLEHLATFGDAHGSWGGGCRDPHRSGGVQADAVGCAELFGEIRPHPPVGELAIRRHIECGESKRKGLGHDQRAAIGREHHAVRKDHVLRGDMH